MNDSKHSAPVARIMIVVASAPLRSAIRQCLQMLQPACDCIEAAGAHEALGIARARPIDVALLDLQLPAADPGQLLDQLAALDPRMRIHLLGDPRHSGAGPDRLAGAAGVLSKDNLYEELGRLAQGLRFDTQTDPPARSA